MAHENKAAHPPEDQEEPSQKKENNPFSEDEKHGPGGARRSPRNAEEYQGDPSVQRRTPGIEDDAEEDERRSA
ncbi:MAG TPA: hypothetical protein VK828_20985 [Terriglobales bacterium]|jgi:hypothetical protein|nr:hypothetical protein [Terriglobales bacterium]